MSHLLLSSAIFSLGVLVAVLIGVRRYRFARGERTDRFQEALVPLCGWVVLGHFLCKIWASIFQDYNWIRLQTVFALAKAGSPYSDPDSGVILPSLYGPVSVLAYLPSVLGSSPESIMRIAAGVAVAIFFFPVFLIFLRASREKQMSPAQGRLIFFIFCFFVLIDSPLRLAAFQVHADAPALGLGALACFMVMRRKNFSNDSWMWSSALFAVLAVWAKQVALPLLIALPLYIVVIEGKEHFFKYSTRLLVLSAVVSAVFVIGFGGDRLFFHLIAVPSRHPWSPGGLGIAFMRSLFEILFFVPLWVLLMKDFGAFKKSARGFFEELKANPFWWVALLMIPTAFLGKIKVGGSNNALSYVFYYLLIATLLTFFSGGSQEVSSKLKKTTVWIASIFILIHLPGVYQRLIKNCDSLNYARVAYEYAKNHPGTAYFPRLGLISFLAEGQFYHDSVALKDRRWARFPVSQEHYRAHVPKNLKLIAFREGADDDMDWSFETGFSPRTQITELPGFRVYLKEGNF